MAAIREHLVVSHTSGIAEGSLSYDRFVAESVRTEFVTNVTKKHRVLERTPLKRSI